MPVRALEFYSGVGGLHLAFLRSGVSGSVVQAFDWDPIACQVYEANHGQNIVRKVDISTITVSMLVSYQADLWLLSPACQPYTILNPAAKGAADPRAKSFLHLLQVVLPGLTALKSQPACLLIENVAGFESSSTRQITLSTLRSLGYMIAELLITPLQFGIPNSRLRYYLLAKLSPSTFHCIPAYLNGSDVIWRHIPGHAPWIDPRFRLLTTDNNSVDEVQSGAIQTIDQYLDEPIRDGHDHPHTIPAKTLEKWGRLFDIVLPSTSRTCCFTRGYSQLVERTGSVLQMNESLNTTDTFARFIQAQSEGDENAVEILQPLGLRYFSPSELLRLFHFTSSNTTFIWPSGISNKTKYRLIGNSVNVHVVQQLIRYLYEN